MKKGNDVVGLNHILKRHADDFSSKHNVSEEKVANHILDLIANGNVEYARTVKRGNREGLEKLYSHKGNYFLLAGIGTNGFVASVYPISENEAKKLIERYKKDGKKDD